MANPVFTNSQTLSSLTSLQFGVNARSQVQAELEAHDKTLLFNKTEPEPGLASSEYGKCYVEYSGEFGDREYCPNNEAVELSSRHTECAEAATYSQKQVNVDDDGGDSELSPQTLNLPGVSPEEDHDNSVSSRQTVDSDVESSSDCTTQALSESGISLGEDLVNEDSSRQTADSDVESIDDNTHQGLGGSGFPSDITTDTATDITSDSCVRKEENVSKHTSESYDANGESSVATVIQGLNELEVQPEEVNLTHDLQHNQDTVLHAESTAKSKTQFLQLQQYWKKKVEGKDTTGSLGSS